MRCKNLLQLIFKIVFERVTENYWTAHFFLICDVWSTETYWTALLPYLRLLKYRDLLDSTSSLFETFEVPRLIGQHSSSSFAMFEVPRLIGQHSSSSFATFEVPRLIGQHFFLIWDFWGTETYWTALFFLIWAIWILNLSTQTDAVTVFVAHSLKAVAMIQH